MIDNADHLLLAAALRYVHRGWPVLPLHSPQDGHCSCGRESCDSPAKHPRTVHGLKDATTDEAIIRAWWTQWPDANVGICTGAISGLVVLDVDPRHGGDDSLADLVSKHGILPQTAEALTGGGGRHILFAHPGSYIKSKAIMPGLDIKADGGYIVASPSLHISGRLYAWELSSHPDDVRLAPVPAWISALATDRVERSQQGAPEGEHIPKGNRNARLTSLAGTMRRPGMSEKEILAALLVANGDRCDPPLDQEEVERIAASVSRYEPEREISDLAPAWPVMASPAFHGLAGVIVAAIDPYTEADPAAVLLHLLTAFGNLVGAGPHAKVGHTLHPARLFSVVVGETSKARKGTAWSTPRYLFEKVNPTWVRSNVKSGGLASGEGLIWAVRDPVMEPERIKEKGQPARYEITETDPGISDKRLLIVEAEFASALTVMNREGNILSPILRQAWDEGNLSPLTKNNRITATGAHISLIGHITSTELIRHLGDTEKANGFGNRFLWVLVCRSKYLPEGAALPEPLLKPLVHRLSEALTRSQQVGEVARDEEARQMWAGVYPALSEGKSGLTGALLARAEAQVLRLSLVYALLEGSALIQRPHLEAALAVWDYCEASAKLIFGDSLGDPVADRILAALKTEDLSETEIRDLLGRNYSSRRIDAALNLIQRAGLALPRSETTAGRPRTVWHRTTKTTKGV